MKRIEVKLAVPIVAPLLDVIRELADDLSKNLAAPISIQDIDADFQESWTQELLAGQGDEVKTLLALFNEEFFAEGIVAFDENNAETIIRACSAVRLRLREKYLKGVGDDTLESGDLDLDALEEPIRKAFMCYLFLATVQELIIQHLDESILDT